MPEQYKNTPISNGNGLVFVAVPRERMYITGFVDNRDLIIAKLMETQRYGGSFQAEGHRVDVNRDILAENFLKAPRNPEWMLMLDSDMQHPIDIAERLIRWAKPIVGGLYFYRGNTHDPFFFRRISDIKDKHGRTVPRWISLRKEVYDFLKSNNVPVRDGQLTIDNYKGEALLECDAVATGAMLIHRTVIEHMKPPWFEYHDGGTSEDLQFCLDAKEYGIPVYGDMSTISGHYMWQPMGHSQFMKLHEQRGVHFSRFADEPSGKQLAKFYEMPESMVDHMIKGGHAQVVGEYWRDKFGDRVPTVEEVSNFYMEDRTGRLYIIELLHWNSTEDYFKMQEQLVRNRNMVCYDIGAGIGTIAIQLMLQDNKVIALEKNPLLRKFIQYRIDRLEKEMIEKFDIELRDTPYMEQNTVDLITALDVFEHIPLEELKLLLKSCYDVLKPDGHMIHTSNFKMQEAYPMHYDYSDIYDNILKETGFTPISKVEAIKYVDS